MKEITVKNDNSSEPFEMGENLYLQQGDKSVVLRVIFPMQVSAQCILISGKINNLRLNEPVISGKIYKPLKLDSFDTFIGFTKNDSIDKALTVLGDSFAIISSSLSQTIIFWNNEVEENCYVEISSENDSGDPTKISRIKISSELIKNGKFAYLDTSNKGTVHFLRSKGIKDPCLKLFGLSSSSIIQLFGKPEEEISNTDFFSLNYKSSHGTIVSFFFSQDTKILYSINIQFQDSHNE
ncbi:MAG TPA: hypothetical protein PK624_12000 [Spirochaetota bacterium]|nr:hypothetical protein [Spirochaetota bacterium]HOR45505.1 hypothetical protein [Spirochaetota bacterium]HPK57170.1 hypothetical protein [Spirochaetota bacterium]